MTKLALVFEDHTNEDGEELFSMRLEHPTIDQETDLDRPLTLAEQMAWVAHDSMISFINSQISEEGLELGSEEDIEE